MSFFSRFKVLNSLLEIEGRPRVSHPLGNHMDITKDKHGMAKAVLKMPYRRRQEDQPVVDYPSDAEEEAIAVASANPILGGGKLGRHGAASGIEVEDDLGEIDNEMFAIPQHRTNRRKGADDGFSTDFTTTVLGIISIIASWPES